MTKLKLTLVHGTFGYDTPWIVKNSSFRKKIMQRLGKKYDVEFLDQFRWGQESKWKRFLDNTINARLSGSENLQRHIIGQEDDSKHFIISHSHGGNVALYAMKNKRVAENITGLICVATPFLDHEKINKLSPSLILATLVLLLFSWESNSVLLKIYSSIFALLVTSISLVKYLLSEEKIKKILDKINLPDSNPWPLEEAKILVMHTEGDEAYRTLNLSSFFSNTLKRVWSVGSFLLENLFGIIILSGLLLWGLSMIPMFFEFTERGHELRLLIENKVGMPLIILISFLAIVSGITKFIHAPEYILWIQTIKLKVVKKLDWNNVKNIQVSFNNGDELRHSEILEHAVDDICNWIENKTTHPKREKAIPLKSEN